MACSLGLRSLPAVAASNAPTAVETESYFDRLDAAFGSLPGVASAELPAANEPPQSLADEIDWFVSQKGPRPAPATDRWDVTPPSVAHPDLPLSNPGSMTPPAPVAPPVAAVAAPVTAPAPTLPPLADAFAALLAAEQSGPSSAVAPEWPGASVSAAAMSDEALEEVTRRVLDRLSDRVIRETVADIVSAVAERLVREEIERIKGRDKGVGLPHSDVL